MGTYRIDHVGSELIDLLSPNLVVARLLLHGSVESLLQEKVAMLLCGGPVGDVQHMEVLRNGFCALGIIPAGIDEEVFAHREKGDLVCDNASNKVNSKIRVALEDLDHIMGDIWTEELRDRSTCLKQGEDIVGRDSRLGSPGKCPFLDAIKEVCNQGAIFLKPKSKGMKGLTASGRANSSRLGGGIGTAMSAAIGSRSTGLSIGVDGHLVHASD